MLSRGPTERISAIQALENPWLRPLTFTELDMNTAISHESSENFASRLNSWPGTSHFEKVILMLVAHQAKQKDVEDMRAAFVALDRDGNGSLSRQELCVGLKSMGSSMTARRFNDVYKWLDSNENSKLDYSEWLCATMEPSMISAESSMQELFDFLDADGNGYVSQEELLLVTSADDVDEVLAQSDTSKDGRIDFKEFKAFMETIARMRSRPG